MGSGVNWAQANNDFSTGLTSGRSLCNISSDVATGAVNFFTANAYRPTQWGMAGMDDEQLVYMKTNIGGYFFDAIIKAEHTTSRMLTEHPIQNGTNIVDHSFQLPARLVLEIGMSDAMDSLVQDQYPSVKSVSAYQQLLALQRAGNALSVTTRLNVYENMVIEQITSSDDYKTMYGLRAIVTLRQIMLATVAETTVPTSDREQVTQETQKGTIQPDSSGSALSKFEDWVLEKGEK